LETCATLKTDTTGAISASPQIFQRSRQNKFRQALLTHRLDSLRDTVNQRGLDCFPAVDAEVVFVNWKKVMLKTNVLPFGRQALVVPSQHGSRKKTSRYTPVALLVALGSLLASAAFAQNVRVIAPENYLPGIPVLVRVEVRDAQGAVDRHLWDAEAVLTSDQPGVTLAPNRVVLYNGMGAALVTISGTQNFALNAVVGELSASRSMAFLSSTTTNTVSGTLEGSSTTWSNVVRVTGDLTVPSGHALTVLPGTWVLVNGVPSGNAGTRITVQGTMQSLGTLERPVTFTAVNPDEPWGEIRHTSAQPSLYRNTMITRAGHSPSAGHVPYAGIVFRASGSQVTFEDSSIAFCPGKALNTTSGSSITMTNCLVTRTPHGGELSATAFLAEDSWFTEFFGPDDNDAIYLHGQQAGQDLILRGCVFAKTDDDGIDCLNSRVVIEDCIVRDIFDKAISQIAGRLDINRCLIVNSDIGISVKGQGLAVNGTIHLDRTTLSTRTQGIAVENKFGIATVNLRYYVTNSIIRAINSVITDYDPSMIEIYYSNVGQFWPGPGNITAEPMFVNGLSDFRLQPGSPCIDAGDPDSPNDPDGTRADMGVYPFTSTGGLFVSITSPRQGDAFIVPTNITIQAVAGSSTGSVERVEFYQASTLLGQSFSSPYSFVWNDVPLGSYSLRAIAIDSAGLRATSGPVNITVATGGPRTNQFISLGSVWNYLDDGSDQGAAWRALGFDDSAWASGPAPLGYCTGNCPYTFNTIVGFGGVTSLKHITTYFRRAFVVDDPSRVESLTLNIRRDDGAVVYINGQEVFRINMPSGEITYLTTASSASDFNFVQTQLPPGAMAALVPGTNVLAISVHQANRTSSDIILEAELRGVISAPTNLPPFVSITSPANNTTIAAPGSITISVNATDLDGSVTNVEFFANGSKLGEDASAPFSYHWLNIPSGTYALTAVATDNFGLASTSSVVQMHVSTDTAPPVITSVQPAPGTVTDLTQVTVTFSKNVVGVDASDLLVNGVPALTLSGEGNVYTFGFPQPAYGVVTFSWQTAHGISDVFTPPHPFNATAPGAGWQYQFVDVVPPSVAELNPPHATTVASLRSVTVFFSEPVTGVTASDLLINGIPASSVSGSGAGPYVFEFTAAPDGAVQATWAANHGIRDEANNAFAGGSWSYTVNSNLSGVVISEIMYHPANANVLEEFIELHNRGAADVDLTGWRLTSAVRFTFPEVTIPAGGYLVVAADLETFAAKYPDVTNVVGNWSGILSNSRETINLRNAENQIVNSVSYADEGDWAIRARGPLDLGHYGWRWVAEHDGLGKSIELINPVLSNAHGQNWASSVEVEGTPGRANSVSSNNIAPKILSAAHFPMVPRSTDTVFVTGRIVDEQPLENVTVRLFYRIDSASPPPFTMLPMRDDGLNGDGLAGDGVYGATLPAHPHDTIIDFYIEATDAQGNVRTWPAAARQLNGSFAQTANMLYQVDDSEYTGTQPLYKFIMTEVERAELLAIGSGCYSVSNPCQSQSDAQMNGTFVAMDGTGAQLRYTVGIRNRGHGTRNRKPNNYRVNFRSDDTWKGVTALNINAQYTWLQHFGAVISLRSGVAGANARAIQLRVNNANLAFSGNLDRTYGSYVALEAINNDWSDLHFPNDSSGNIYRAIRDIPPSAFNYRGEDKNAYTNTWFKQSNRSEDDWTDLVAMLRVMGTNDLFTTQNVREVVNVEQWLTHLAVMALFNSRETGLNTGDNDDYYMYRGINDPRFILVFYDLDTILGEGSSAGSTTSSIFGAAALPAFNQFMRWPDFEPIYYQILQRLIDTTFSETQFNAMLDQTLDYVPTAVRNRMKTWMNARRAYVRSVIAPNLPPPTIPVVATLSGIPRSPTSLTSATLTVGGEGITHYRWKLNDGAYGSETPVSTPIELSNSGEGTQTISVIGKNSANVWQSETSPTVRAWNVNPAWPAVRINEVLAQNNSAVNHFGTFPDLIELYNEGAGAVDLSGMRLSDNPNNPNKFTFPNGTVLGAGQYLVLYANNPDGTPGIHLGFSLDRKGEGVYLYDRAASGGGLLDSVEFGLQLPDFSIGRLNGGDWFLTQPTFGAANVSQPLGSQSALKINEWLTFGLSPYPDDFIELYNPDPLPVALGGLHLTDQPIGAPGRHQIAALSFIGGGGYSVFIADNDPGKGADHVNFRLASEQGEIGLFSAELEEIDWVIYGPQRRDISFGRCPDGSPFQTALALPTPGAANQCVIPVEPEQINLVPIDYVWKYEQSGTDLGTEWREPDYEDAAWPEGPGLLARENDPLPEPIRTQLTYTSPQQITFYFRTRFTLDPSLNVSGLSIRHIIDDGAIIYLNGEEVHRYNLPAGPVTYSTLASPGVNNAVYQGPYTIPVSALRPGENVLAVEVHQQNATSSDVVFGMTLDALVTTVTPGTAGVVINEVLANNSTLAEPDGSTPDYVELYNPSTSAVDLAGMGLTDNMLNPRRWVFPAGSIIPGQGFFVVRLDSDAPASEDNTGFGLKSGGGSVFLFNRVEEGGSLLSSVTYGIQPADWSIGRIPDGSTNWTLNIPTFGSPNTAASLGSPLTLKVNEWMAAPRSGEDWFEIFNPDPQPVELSRLHLTDNLNNRTKYQIPPLSFIGTGLGAFQRFEADDDTAQGGQHVNFKLSASGEALGISTEAGALIDGISFGQQQTGVSEGRLPDGSNNIVRFPATPTPGRSNFLPMENIVVNEVLSHSDAPLEDAIEFHNITGEAVDISGWFLSDSQNNLRKYQVPAGTLIAPYGYHVFYEYQFNGPDAGEPFALSSVRGDNVFLSSATPEGALTGYRAFVRFGPTENGVSLGRYQTSVGVDFVAMSARTFGMDNPTSLEQFRAGTGLSNAYPKVGPVVISQIHYHPPGNADHLEFIELRNITSSNVPLFDPAHPQNTWRLRNAVRFDFPSGTVIPGNGSLVVVSFDPQTDPASLAAFQASFGTNATLAGPFTGKLDNAGETIELFKPDSPQNVPGPDFGFVPYILVESVEYSDRSPWPMSADGLGDSLHRIDPAEYGNDPVNWRAAAPELGSDSGSLDSDGDGMPDGWELAHGFNPHDPSDASQDADGDGMTNLEEYLAGTDPRDPGSYFRFEVTVLSGNEVRIEFNAVAGKTYTIEYRDSLTAGEWLKLVDLSAEPVSRPVIIPDAASNNHRFYRLVTPAQP
jgi:hypothetical protein